MIKKEKRNRLAMLTTLLLFAACGGGGGSDDSACGTLKVAGGQECSSLDNPTVLLLLNNGEGACSGTIITRTSVITAAHCIVGVQSIDVLHNAIESVQHAYFHNQYRGGVGPYDLAIVKVSTEFTDAANFSPLPLNVYEDIPFGQVASIFGYGLDPIGAPSIDFPKAGFVEVLGVEGNGMIRTGIVDSFGLPGDSGGPLVLNNSLLGVLSGYSIGRNPPVNYFVNLRDTANMGFINEIASDVAVKSSNGELRKLEYATKWAPQK